MVSAKKKIQKKEKAAASKRKRAEIGNVQQRFGSKVSAVGFDWSKVKLTVPLQNHQKETLEKIREKREERGYYGNGALINLPMGYGKTLIGIAQLIQMILSAVLGTHPLPKGLGKNILVVCSSRDILLQWAEEIQNKTNIPYHSNVFIWSETKKFPKMPKNDWNIVLTTYNIVFMADKADLAQPFARNFWGGIITDEAHTYRNNATCRAVALLRLILGLKASPQLRQRLGKKSKGDGVGGSKKKFSELLIPCENEGSPLCWRMFLSGTPLVNSVWDLFIHSMILQQNVYNCPVHHEDHLFAEEDYWRKNLSLLAKDKQDEDAYRRAQEIYKEFIQLAVISFDEETIATMLDLPPRYLHLTDCKCPPGVHPELALDFIKDHPQTKAYYCVAHTFKELCKELEEKEDRLSKAEVKTIRSQMIVCIQFLTMLSLHPACIRNELGGTKTKDISHYGQLLLEAYKDHGIDDLHFSKPTPKITAILKILKSIKKEDPKAKTIIFTSYRSFLKIVAWHLKKNGITNYSMYCGGMSKAAKTKALDDFKNGDSDILLMVFKTGSLGLNLQHATRMIICEPPYTFAEWIQAVCRMYRIGQTLPVHIYDLVMKGSIDIWRMLKNTFKFQLQKKFWETGSGTYERKTTLKDTRDLYHMLCDSDITVDSETARRLNDKQQKLFHMQVEKLAASFENYDDTEIPEEEDGDDDSLELEFEEDEFQEEFMPDLEDHDDLAEENVQNGQEATDGKEEDEEDVQQDEEMPDAPVTKAIEVAQVSHKRSRIDLSNLAEEDDEVPLPKNKKPKNNKLSIGFTIGRSTKMLPTGHDTDLDEILKDLGPDDSSLLIEF